MLKPEEYSNDILKGEDSLLLAALNKYAKCKKLDDTKLLVSCYVVMRLLESSGFILDTNINKLREDFNKLFSKNIAERTFQTNFKFGLDNGYYRKDGDGNEYNIFITPSICRALGNNRVKLKFRVNDFEKRLEHIERLQKEMEENPKYNGPTNFKDMLQSFRAESENKTSNSLSPNTLVTVGSKRIPYSEFKKILLARKERRESLPKEFSYPTNHGNRPVRGNIYVWAEEKEKARIERMGKNAILPNDIEDFIRREKERADEELKQSQQKALAEARESRRVSGPVSLQYDSTVQRQKPKKTMEEIMAKANAERELAYQKATLEKQNEDGGNIVYRDTDY